METVAVLVIACGGVRAVINPLVGGKLIPKKTTFRPKRGMGTPRCTGLLIGLEFELGVDIIRFGDQPTWEQLGHLGSIAVIRTFLNYFLEKDVEKYAESSENERRRAVENPA